MEIARKDIFTKPENLAVHMYKAKENFFAEMSDEEFERWLNDEMKKPYICLEGQEIAIAIEFKKAMCYYLGFLYHSAILSK